MVSIDQISANYPLLYHMAAPGSWDNIRQNGLLSTSSLLDLFEIQDERRHQIEECHRPECIEIFHPRYGTAIIRDQKPMSDNRLNALLDDNLTPADWYRILNQNVFFWLRRERLNSLRHARAYRDSRQTIITVDTRALLERHNQSVLLSPINSGCTWPSPARRGMATFTSMENYGFEERRRLRGLSSAIVELAVRGAVPDIADYVVHVVENGGGQPDSIFFTR